MVNSTFVSLYLFNRWCFGLGQVMILVFHIECFKQISQGQKAYCTKIFVLLVQGVSTYQPGAITNRILSYLFQRFKEPGTVLRI